MAKDKKVTKKALIKNIKALNDADLLDDPIEVDDDAEVNELAEDFIQAIEEIDDAGDADDIPKPVLKFYEKVLDFTGADTPAKGDSKGDDSKDGDDDKDELVKLIEALNDEDILDEEIDIDDDDDADELKEKLIDAINDLDDDDKDDVPDEVMEFYKSAKGGDDEDDDAGDDEPPLEEKLPDMEFKEVKKFVKANGYDMSDCKTDFNKANWNTEKKQKKLIKYIVKQADSGSAKSAGKKADKDKSGRKPFERKKDGGTVHEIAARAIMEQKKAFTLDDIANISIAEREKNGDTTGSCKAYAKIALAVCKICGVVDYDKSKKKYTLAK